VAYGARLESVLGLRPRGFESRILRHYLDTDWGGFVPGTGYRSQRVARRRQLLLQSAVILVIVLTAFFLGRATKATNFVPVEGSEPTPCITLAVFPNEFLPPPSDTNINVLNGSKRVGLATITAEIMGERGFKIDDISNFDEYIVQATAEIHYGESAKDKAFLVSLYIENAVLVLDDRADSSIDLIVGQNFTTLQSNEQVEAEKSRPVASPSGPGC
jgi:hypothetical protein